MSELKTDVVEETDVVEAPTTQTTRESRAERTIIRLERLCDALSSLDSELFQRLHRKEEVSPECGLQRRTIQKAEQLLDSISYDIARLVELLNADITSNQSAWSPLFGISYEPTYRELYTYYCHIDADTL